MRMLVMLQFVMPIVITGHKFNFNIIILLHKFIYNIIQILDDLICSFVMNIYISYATKRKCNYRGKHAVKLL